MSKPQVITTPRGEEMVVLSRAEYDALVAAAEDVDEDAADIAMYDARKSALARGDDAPLPLELSALLLRGHGLIKSLRKWRGLSQGALASAIGCSQGYLSDIEARRRRGGSELLAKIAAALDVDPSWLSPVAGPERE